MYTITVCVYVTGSFVIETKANDEIHFGESSHIIALDNSRVTPKNRHFL